MTLGLEYKFADITTPFILDGKEIEPGSSAYMSIDVGRLPSDTRIHVNAHVFRGEHPGPTVLLLAGVHGDEINGIETLRGLIGSEVLNLVTHGNVIVVPLLNIYGFINFSRDVPDGKDVNRSFPGTASGSLASRVARVISNKILPLIDVALDFHTGGASRYNYPQIRYSPKDNQAKILAHAFYAPYTIEKATISKSFRKICREQGIPAIVYEGGESIRLDGLSIEKAQNGITYVLDFLNMGEFDISTPAYQRIQVKRTSWIRAPYSGIFIWSKQSGTYIQRNEVIGTINDPYGQKSVRVTSNRAGYIIGHNNASVVNHGDALYHLAHEFEIIE